MPSSTRLGGFKILKGVSRFSLALPGRGAGTPAGFFRVFAARRINLPYIAMIRMIRHGRAWCLNAMVEEHDTQRATRALWEAFGISVDKARCGVLSLFPHRSDPGVPAKLLRVLALEGIAIETLANSPAAVSVGLKEAWLERAGQALFRPFSFSAYRTPADWRLAQEGKEALYREVVASYQEQRPKVYGLEVREGLVLNLLQLQEGRTNLLGRVFEQLAALEIHLSFLSACTCRGHGLWAFCLPRGGGNPSGGFLDELPAAAPHGDTGSGRGLFHERSAFRRPLRYRRRIAGVP